MKISDVHCQPDKFGKAVAPGVCSAVAFIRFKAIWACMKTASIMPNLIIVVKDFDVKFQFISRSNKLFNLRNISILAIILYVSLLHLRWYGLHHNRNFTRSTGHVPDLFSFPFLLHSFSIKLQILIKQVFQTVLLTSFSIFVSS